MRRPTGAFELCPFLCPLFDRLRPRSPSARGDTLAVHDEFERQVIAQDRVDALLTFAKAPKPFTFKGVSQLFCNGAGAPPPARAVADASPRMSSPRLGAPRWGPRCGRRRRC